MDELHGFDYLGKLENHTTVSWTTSCKEEHAKVNCLGIRNMCNGERFHPHCFLVRMSAFRVVQTMTWIPTKKLSPISKRAEKCTCAASPMLPAPPCFCCRVHSCFYFIPSWFFNKTVDLLRYCHCYASLCQTKIVMTKKKKTNCKKRHSGLCDCLWASISMSYQEDEQFTSCHCFFAFNYLPVLSAVAKYWCNSFYRLFSTLTFIVSLSFPVCICKQPCPLLQFRWGGFLQNTLKSLLGAGLMRIATYKYSVIMSQDRKPTSLRFLSLY